MFAPGRLVHNMPNAMVNNRSGSYFFLIARYISRNETSIITTLPHGIEAMPIEEKNFAKLSLKSAVRKFNIAYLLLDNH